MFPQAGISGWVCIQIHGCYIRRHTGKLSELKFVKSGKYIHVYNLRRQAGPKMAAGPKKNNKVKGKVQIIYDHKGMIWNLHEYDEYKKYSQSNSKHVAGVCVWGVFVCSCFFAWINVNWIILEYYVKEVCKFLSFVCVCVRAFVYMYVCACKEFFLASLQMKSRWWKHQKSLKISLFTNMQTKEVPSLTRTCVIRVFCENMVAIVLLQRFHVNVYGIRYIYILV